MEFTESIYFRAVRNLRRGSAGMRTALVCVAFAACQGEIARRGDTPEPTGQPGRDPGTPGVTAGAPGKTPAPGTDPGTGTPMGPTPAGPSTTGAVALTALTRAELNNSIRLIFGVTTNPANVLPADLKTSGGFAAPPDVNALYADRLYDMGAAVGAAVAAKIDTFAPCPAADQNGTKCLDAFLDTYGRRIYRRPLTASDRAEVAKLYTAARGEPLKSSYADAMRLVVTGLLASPAFVYHWELGDASPKIQAGRAKLTGYELAARLSFLVTASGPDDALLDAASTGELDAGDGLEKQARRLLKDARARDGVFRHYAQMFTLEKIPTVIKDTQLFPAFTADLKSAMVEESQRFVERAVLTDGKLETLLTSNVTFANAALAAVYGISGVTGTDLREVKLDGAKRAGLFSQLNFLATQASPAESHPVKRGAVIWQQLICGVLGQMPQNVPPVGAAKPGVSTRERFAEHGKSACATACHERIDPPGFAFESFDSLGAYRATDANQPVNTSGSFTLPSGAEITFKNAVELMGALAKSEDVRRCATTQWARDVLGRRELDVDRGEIDGLHKKFAASGYDLRELIVATTASAIFQYRAFVGQK